MKKVVTKHNSFAAADEADKLYYQSLTPSQRIEILLRLVAQQRAGQDGTRERFTRVYRIAERI